MQYATQKCISASIECVWTFLILIINNSSRYEFRIIFDQRDLNE